MTRKIFPDSQNHGWPWTADIPQYPETMPDGSPWPRISIVTPSYNQGQFLEETIRSVLLQGYPNLEYIIIDGGSTDNSVEIIKKYEPWLTYWVSEPDRGQSHAINKGFARSTGEIMAWLNSDDVYTKNTLITAIKPFIADSPCSIVVGKSIMTNGPDSYDGRVRELTPSFDEMIYAGKTFPQPSVFWRSELWKITGQLNERLYYVFDFDWWLRASFYSKRTIFLNEILSIERTHPQQKTNLANDNKRIERLEQEKTFSIVNAVKQKGISKWRLAFLYLIRRVKDLSRKKHIHTLFNNKSFNRKIFCILFRSSLPTMSSNRYSKNLPIDVSETGLTF